MCDTCDDVKTRLRRFYSLDDYRNCIAYIADLIASGQFEMIEQTHPLDAVQNQNGCWCDDIIQHVFICKECGEQYVAFADTYHGVGDFEKHPWYKQDKYKNHILS